MQRGCDVIRRGYCDVEVAKEDCCKRVKKERYPVALQQRFSLLLAFRKPNRHFVFLSDVVTQWNPNGA